MIKRLADKLFEWYCHPDYYPDIKGDLEELYTDHLEEGKYAEWKYFIDVVLLFRISLHRPLFKNSLIKDTGMFKNYFKISIRNLARHKMFTAINVIGLAIGLSSFLLINEYIRFEKSYDAFFTDADQLYRVSYVAQENGKDGVKDAMSSYLVGEVLNDELPEVVQHTVTKKLDKMTMRFGNDTFIEDYAVSADSNFLKMFDYKILQGSIDEMMSQPLSVVLTASRAKAYFKGENPKGKTIEELAPMKATLKVTGVIEDVPENTHYTFDMLISDKTMQERYDYKSWNWNNYYVYVKFMKGTDLTGLQEKVTEITYKYVDEERETRLDIHPVKDIYLKTDFTYEPQVHGSQQAVTFLVIISIFIIVIAWVNYVNLSTARAIDRAKEVGLRKVIGAFKRQLIGQFLFEAFLINFLGAILAMCLAEILLPFFNGLIGKEIVENVWNHTPFLISLIGFWVLGALISGFYPAIVLSGFKPITVLKGKFRTSKRGVALRKGLVIVQFAASLVLITSTFIVHQQVSYMQNKDIGISVDKVVSVSVPTPDIETEEQYNAFVQRTNSFKDALKAYASIESVGATSNLPGGDAADINATTTKLKIVGLTDLIDGTTYVQYNDDEFLEAVDMTLIAGRDFDRKMKSDSSAVLVNEAFLDRFNVPNVADMVNERIQIGDREENRRTIIGVVKNYNRTTLKSQVEPTIYIPSNEERNLVIQLPDSDY